MIKNNKDFSNGSIACYDGIALHWQLFESLESAKQNFDGYPIQIKKQMKTFKQEAIKLKVCGIEVPAYKLKVTSLQGYSSTQLVFWGTINDEIIFGQIQIKNNIDRSTDLTDFFQQLIEF
jgi:hypothetical protein